MKLMFCLFRPKFHNKFDWYGIKRAWVAFWTILYCLNRQAELKRLIRWAGQKSLDGPLTSYRARLIDEENRLLKYRIQTPKLIFWARVMQIVGNLISPKPKFLPKGAASTYRFQKQKVSNKTI